MLPNKTPGNKTPEQQDVGNKTSGKRIITGKYLGCGINVDYTGDEDGMKAAKEKLQSESRGKFKWVNDNVLTVYDKEIWELLGLPPIEEEESPVRTSLPVTPVTSSHNPSHTYVPSVHERRQNMRNDILQILISLSKGGFELWETRECRIYYEATFEEYLDGCLSFRIMHTKQYFEIKNVLMVMLKEMNNNLKINCGDGFRGNTYDIFTFTFL